jgi:hypothetical protein
MCWVCQAECSGALQPRRSLWNEQWRLNKRSLTSLIRVWTTNIGRVSVGVGQGWQRNPSYKLNPAIVSSREPRAVSQFTREGERGVT